LLFTPTLQEIYGMKPRKEFMVQTQGQQRFISRLLCRLGYCYIIGWKDVQGWGIYGVWRADWQNESSYPYINLR